MFNPRLLTLSTIIFVAAMSRLIPHPWNFTPVVAVALFGGAHFTNRGHAFLVPLAAVFMSDMVLGFYRHMIPVYFSYILIVGIGLLLRSNKAPHRVALGAINSSILFFVITNFGVWSYGFYGYTFDGLMKCYTVGIPYFRNMLVGDLFFTGLLFGGFHLAQMKFASLREQPALAA